jgi:hypothetical protein
MGDEAGCAALGIALLELYGKAERECDICEDRPVCEKNEKTCDWGMVHWIWAEVLRRVPKDIKKVVEGGT